MTDAARQFAQQAFLSINQRLESLESKLLVLNTNLGVLNANVHRLCELLEQGASAQGTLQAAADLAKALKRIRP